MTITIAVANAIGSDLAVVTLPLWAPAYGPGDTWDGALTWDGGWACERLKNISRGWGTLPPDCFDAELGVKWWVAMDVCVQCAVRDWVSRPVCVGLLLRP